MREFLFLTAALILMIWPASGAPVCDEGHAARAGVSTIGQCTVGPFVFSNFSVSPGLDMGGAAVHLDAAWHSASMTAYYLRFGANFNLLDPNLYRDVIFTYQVTGPRYEIDGALGGTGLESLAETICGAPFADTTCPSLEVVPGTLVLDWTKTIAQTTVTGSAGTYHLPDPAALLLIGSGLIVLGMFRRSRKT